jgi:hypothetical protein
VVTLNTIQHQVLARDDLGLQTRLSLLAYITVPGVSARMNRKQERRYRTLAAAMGLTAIVGDFDSRAEAGFVRLDFENGREVVRAA